MVTAHKVHLFPEETQRIEKLIGSRMFHITRLPLRKMTENLPSVSNQRVKVCSLFMSDSTQKSDCTAFLSTRNVVHF